MSHAPHWVSGSHWFVCDVCGFDYRADQKRRRWDGAIVCPKCVDPDPRIHRDPPPNEGHPVLDARPDPEEEYVSVTVPAYSNANPGGEPPARD